MNALFNQEAKCRMCDSAKSLNPRPQGQGVTIWLGKRTRVRFRVPPPKFNAQPFSVGRFHFCFPQTTRGSRPFCVCRGCARSGPQGSRFDSLLPSVLSKSPPTLSRWHAQSALFVKHLCACHREWFACVFARAELSCIKPQGGEANPRVTPWVETDRRRSCCAHGSVRLVPG